MDIWLTKYIVGSARSKTRNNRGDWDRRSVHTAFSIYYLGLVMLPSRSGQSLRQQDASFLPAVRDTYGLQDLVKHSVYDTETVPESDRVRFTTTI